MHSCAFHSRVLINQAVTEEINEHIRRIPPSSDLVATSPLYFPHTPHLTLHTCTCPVTTLTMSAQMNVANTYICPNMNHFSCGWKNGINR